MVFRMIVLSGSGSLNFAACYALLELRGMVFVFAIRLFLPLRALRCCGQGGVAGLAVRGAAAGAGAAVGRVCVADVCCGCSCRFFVQCAGVAGAWSRESCRAFVRRARVLRGLWQGVQISGLGALVLQVIKARNGSLFFMQEASRVRLHICGRVWPQADGELIVTGYFRKICQASGKASRGLEQYLRRA